MLKISRRTFIASTAAGGGTLACGASLFPPHDRWSYEPSPLNSLLFGEATSYRREDFISWNWHRVDDEKRGALYNFDFRFKRVLERKPYDFREEVLRGCHSLESRREGKTIALCLSGGKDSEIIALALHHQGIPFEMYFADNWGRNRDMYDNWVRPLEKKLNRKVEVVSVPRAYFMNEYAPQTFPQIMCEMPTYLMMTYLFAKIPADRFIVTGDGDLERTSALYHHVALENPLPRDAKGTYVPFSAASAAYDLWAKKAQRPGEYYFYSSTPELIASVATDPRFKCQFPFAQTNDVVSHAFPEIRPRPKSTNWDSELARRENSALRLLLQRHSRKVHSHQNWAHACGAIACLDELFTT